MALGHRQPASEVAGVVGAIMALTGVQRPGGMAVLTVGAEAEKELLDQLGMAASAL